MRIVNLYASVQKRRSHIAVSRTSSSLMQFSAQILRRKETNGTLKQFDISTFRPSSVK